MTFIVLVLIIITLSIALILRKPDPVTPPDSKVWTDSILKLKKKIDISHAVQDSLQREYDSLLSLDPQVITRTHDKIKFVYSTATPEQLDSVIRANWKTSSRYH